MSRRWAVCVACVSTLMMLSSVSAGAYVTVHGSPSYTPGVGGYKLVEYYMGHPSVSTGIGVGAAVKYDASDQALGKRAVRWTADGDETELGSLGASANGVSENEPLDLNAQGVIVGWARKYSPTGVDQGTRAVRWDSSGVVTELGGFGVRASDGLSVGEARAINAHGVVAGAVALYDASGQADGFLAVRWDAGSTVPVALGTLGTAPDGGTSALALAINDSNVVVGRSYRYDVSGVYRGDVPVRWDASGAALELEGLGVDANGVANGQALAVNATDDIAGWTTKYTPGGVSLGKRPARWDGTGAVAELDILGTDANGNTVGEAVAINDAGTTVGYVKRYSATGVDLGHRAVRWDAGGTAVTELGNFGVSPAGDTFSMARDINAAGYIVGQAMHLSLVATLWGPDNVAIDLNTLIDPNSGWKLMDAVKISDTGWITGSGMYDPDGFGGQAAYARMWMMYLPSAVPEPSAVLLVLVGGVAVALRRVAR